MGYRPFTRLIQTGDPVTAGTANKPVIDLAGDISYLWELIQAASLGSTVFARQVTVEAGAAHGMPVYYNSATQQFERALAQLDSSAVSGTLTTSSTAQVWGIVYSKTNATLADLLLFGYAPLDISAAVGGPVAAGLYYLSGVTPGGLLLQKPPVSVAVLRSDGNGMVYVVPQFVDFLDQHVHYSFPLTCRPAGTASSPSYGHPHQITAPNAALPGWLPASDPSFKGLAPHDAIFGYNLNADPVLKNAWPPLPVSQAYLDWDRGTDQSVGATGVPLGHNGACILDRNGLWWMSNCWGDVPWPDEFSLSDPQATSESLSESAQCPRPLDMAMTVWFTRINFATDATVVTSLQSTDPRLKVSCLGGTVPATVGDLALTLDLNLVVATDAVGYQILKDFDPATVTFAQGPVCEGLYALSNNIVLTGPTTRHLNPTDPTTPVVFQGPVGISVNATPTYELDVELIRTDVVEEDYYLDVMYLSFPVGQTADIRVKLYVPADTSIPNPQLAMRFLLMGTAAGGLPPMTMTARRLPRPTAGLTVPVALPNDSAEFNVTLTTTATVTAYQYVEATSAQFTVAAGDTIFFTLQRLDTDTYLGDVGVISQTGVLSSGA